MGTWVRGVVVVGLASFALAASGPGAVAGADVAQTPPIMVHVTLNRHHVVAGQRIKGTVTLHNTTHKSIVVDSCATDGWVEVGLKSPTYSPSFGHLQVACEARISPGVNRIPVTVATTYGFCAQPQPSGTPPSSYPTCVISNGTQEPPPLPSGRYTTIVNLNGMTGLTQPPNRVVVTLSAPSKARVLAPCAETPTTAPSLVTVPNVVGESSSVAAVVFAKACLNAGWVSPVGTRVVSEAPAANSKVPEYSTVTLATR